MSVEVTYLISQIFVVINYSLLMVSYQLKNRTKILVINFIALLANALSFLFLGGFSGFGMSIVAIIRNGLFLIDKNKNSNIITKMDIVKLLIVYLLSIICAILTYNGIFSLMIVLAIMLYTYSIWQKNTKVFKLLGIPVSIFYIIYNIYVKSILGIVFEVLLMFSAILGLIREYKN